MKGNQIRLPACVPADRQYEPYPLDLENSSRKLDIVDYFDELIGLYPVIGYLALLTEYDFFAWMNSPAKFVDKWRLAMLISKGEADDDIIESVFEGGMLYPIENRVGK